MARCLNFELYESHLPHFHGSVAFISIYSHVIFLTWPNPEQLFVAQDVIKC